MRITQVLWRQHNGRMFERHWHVKGKRVPIESGAEAYLASVGIKVKDAVEYLKPPRPQVQSQPQQVLPENWNERECLVFQDANVLLEGLPQAQVLLNTLKFTSFPEKLQSSIEKLAVPTSIGKSMHQSVLNACVFDAQQVKLGYKKKDPLRPAYNFPRIYGIEDARKIQLLYQKLVQNCEKVAHQLVSDRRIVTEARFKLPITRNDDQLIFEVGAEMFMSSRKPLAASKPAAEAEMPNIFPILSTISIPKTNTYVKELRYPIQNSSIFGNPHTLLLHFRPLETRNLFETPATDSQFESRALIKAFTAAATRARAALGDSVKDLPQPIVVQAVQSDGQRFQFGLFQLNTLVLDETHGTKNFWHCGPILNLFEECGYKEGKPVLSGYNNEVLRHMLAFYSHS